MGRKILCTLNLNPEEYKPITDLTYPLLKHYAWKMGADFWEINTREFPDCPSVTYEKVQLYKIAQDNDADWAVFVDTDALIHPDTPDFTVLFPRDTVAHHGSDMAAYRWRYDKYMMRDGRNIGSCTWFCMASQWCIDLYHPLEDMTWEEVDQSIVPIVREVVDGVKPLRLIEDFVFSRNIARYGLKFNTIINWFAERQGNSSRFFWHEYAIPIEEKVAHIKDKLREWGLRNDAGDGGESPANRRVDVACGA